MIRNLYIAHEGRRVVITKQSTASGLKNGEVLIQGGYSIHRGSPKARRFAKPGRETVTGGKV